MQLRVVLAIGVLASVTSLLSCGGPVTQTVCNDAAKTGAWTATFKLDTGPSTCPKLDRTVTLPGACDQGCSCTQAEITWVEPSGQMQNGSCALELTQTCFDGSSLDCRDTLVASDSSAAGECYYHGTGAAGSFECSYAVKWEKQ